MALGFVGGLRNSRLDAITTFAGGSGKLRIYSGTQPATGGAITTLLVELTLNVTFAPAAASNVLTLNAITSGTAVATGTPTWARIFKSDGTTICIDMTAAASGADLNISGLSGGQIISGGTVAGSSFTITEANA